MGWMLSTRYVMNPHAPRVLDFVNLLLQLLQKVSSGVPVARRGVMQLASVFEQHATQVLALQE